MPKTAVKSTITVDMVFKKTTANTVVYEPGVDVDFADITSLYIQKLALRDYHDKNGEFPTSVTIEVTLN